MLKLMLITRDPGLAAFAVACGVQRIFVDLEIHGKFERQGHRDTLISDHSFEDVAAIREVIPRHELLVRLNPFHEGSAREIDQAVEADADFIMLPMFTTLDEIRRFVALIDGRVRFVPLVETPQAASLVPDLVHEPGIDELFFGLNDLHLALGLDFMFELLADGSVEQMAQACREAGMPFGFGGIARMEEGQLSAQLILAEHLRLGSSSVILSRTFHRSSTNLSEMHANLDFGREIALLRDHEAALSRRTPAEIEADHQRLVAGIAAVVDQIRASRQC